MVEVISAGKTKLDAFYQASTYAMSMARLYAHFGIEHPGYCIMTCLEFQSLRANGIMNCAVFHLLLNQ